MTDVMFQQSPGALIRRLDDEVLLASPRRDGVELLAGTARSVWDLLESPRTLAAIVESLAGAFAEERRVITSDVASLIVDLEARGLVERVTDDGD